MVGDEVIWCDDGGGVSEIVSELLYIMGKRPRQVKFDRAQ